MQSSILARAVRTNGISSKLFAKTTRASPALFSTSPRSFALNGDGKDVGPDKTHMTDKTGGHKDVQSEASATAHSERALGDRNSQATSERDTGEYNKKAEKESPKAPQPVIGMNDERGGKGH